MAVVCRSVLSRRFWRGFKVDADEPAGRWPGGAHLSKQRRPGNISPVHGGQLGAGLLLNDALRQISLPEGGSAIRRPTVGRTQVPIAKDRLASTP